MAGSRRIFSYTSDNDKRYLIEADESNYEAVNVASVATYNPTDEELEAGNFIPIGLEPRYVIYRSVEGVSIKVVISTMIAAAAIPPTLTVETSFGTVDLHRTFYRGESSAGPFAP